VNPYELTSVYGLQYERILISYALLFFDRVVMIDNLYSPCRQPINGQL